MIGTQDAYDKGSHTCPTCGKVYKGDISNLRRHIRQKHEGAETSEQRNIRLEKYYCVDCDELFARPKILLDHFNSMNHLNHTLPTHNLTHNLNATREYYDDKMEYFSRDWYGNMTTYQSNKSRKEVSARYYQKKKQIKGNESITCECGGKYVPTYRKGHMNSIKHRQFVGKEIKPVDQFHCECGAIVRTSSKTRHLKTKKHLEYINK